MFGLYFDTLCSMVGWLAGCVSVNSRNLCTAHSVCSFTPILLSPKQRINESKVCILVHIKFVQGTTDEEKNYFFFEYFLSFGVEKRVRQTKQKGRRITFGPADYHHNGEKVKLVNEILFSHHIKNDQIIAMRSPFL